MTDLGSSKDLAGVKPVTTSHPPWLQSQYQSGLPAVAKVYADVLAGKGDARFCWMLSMQ